MYIGVSSVEIKSEADSNDSTECSRDDKPSTGMFAVSDDIFSAVSCLYIAFVFTFDEHVGYSLFTVYYPRRARSASAWILFSLWMYVCMFVCMLAL